VECYRGTPENVGPILRLSELLKFNT